MTTSHEDPGWSELDEPDTPERRAFRLSIEATLARDAGTLDEVATREFRARLEAILVDCDAHSAMKARETFDLFISPITSTDRGASSSP